MDIKAIKESPKKINCKLCNDQGKTPTGAYTHYRTYEKFCNCEKGVQDCWNAYSSVSGLIEIFKTDTFHDFNFQSEEMKQLAIKLFSSVKNATYPIDVAAAISGRTGSGKTKIAHFMIRLAVLYHNFTAGVITFQNLINAIKSKNTQKQEYIDAKSRFLKPDVVVLDDLFKHFHVDSFEDRDAIGEFFDIVDQRLTMKKGLIVTSEFALKAVKDIDRALYGRFLELCKGNTYEIPNHESLDIRVQKYEKVGS